jgi:hypothetical protein
MRPARRLSPSLVCSLPSLTECHPIAGALKRNFQEWKIEDEFEIRERHAALEHKLSVISRTAETRLELIQSRHSLRVEWYLVALIIVEIALTLFQTFR